MMASDRGGSSVVEAKADGGPVVVFGSTGRTGVLIVRELLARGIPCRAFVRNAAKAASVLPKVVCARTLSRMRAQEAEVSQWSLPVVSWL